MEAISVVLLSKISLTILRGVGGPGLNQPQAMEIEKYPQKKNVIALANIVGGNFKISDSMILLL